MVTTPSQGKSVREAFQFSAHGAEASDVSKRTPARRRHIVRLGRNVEVRPLGGALGCLTMILVSVIASIILTVVLNLLAR